MTGVATMMPGSLTSSHSCLNGSANNISAGYLSRPLNTPPNPLKNVPPPGPRINVTLGARLNIAVHSTQADIKMMPSDDVKTPHNHRSIPCPGLNWLSDSGVYAVQPLAPAPPTTPKPDSIETAPTTYSQKPSIAI